jgi:hypothetical protein
MDKLLLDSGDHDRGADARQIVGSLDADDVRVAGRQRVQMPVLEGLICSSSTVETLVRVPKRNRITPARWRHGRNSRPVSCRRARATAASSGC